ncbi:MAG: ATP synthase F1 subunit gamma [Candidatus Cloacimonetes bacterium]|nr:ATP synthase F1 subunit gamma [Candidatus Cloacimonadota bacterium]
MANIRDIKNRIESVKNTRQITNAMKMVAAAKLQKSQANIIKARPYADHIAQMLMTIKHKKNQADSRIFDDAAKAGKRALIVVTADRGLCGSFNSLIIKQAVEYLKQHPKSEVICIGKKGYDVLKKRPGLVIKEKYLGLFNEMNFAASAEIAQFIKNIFFQWEYDVIDVVYNHFKSIMQQIITVKALFPIPDLVESEGISVLDFIYEPSMDEVVAELSNKYINVEIWRIMLESSASEQGARMTAMDSATDNASELIESLTLNYNMVRQAAITKEIIEIASGAEALS